MLEFTEEHIKKQKYNLCFTSVNGKRTNLNKYGGSKIFYSGENVDSIIKHKFTKITENAQYRWFDRIQYRYSDYRHKEVDLCMGMGNFEDKYSNYLRFPLWIMYLLQPSSSKDDVVRLVKDLNTKKSVKLHKAVCLNKHDCYGTRSKICNDLNDIMPDIKYPGKWRHNDDSLWNDYNDNKLAYLNTFMFNICPENMDAPSYCTEKLFDAFRAGCIPIYAGAENNPEGECVNQNAIIFWDLDDEYNFESKKLVKRLLEDENYYYKFMAQEKFKSNAAEYIIDRLDTLKKKIEDIL